MLASQKRHARKTMTAEKHAAVAQEAVAIIYRRARISSPKYKTTPATTLFAAMRSFCGRDSTAPRRLSRVACHQTPAAPRMLSSIIAIFMGLF